MPRSRSDTPWLHAASGFWCATVNGQRRYLDKDYTTACRKLKALRKGGPPADRLVQECLESPFSRLADEFLDDIKARRKPITYQTYRIRLLRALRIIGTTLRVGELRKAHLAQIERSLAPRCSPTTVHDTLAVVQAVFAWAVKRELLESNPLIGYDKPRPRRRTRVITDAEFQALLRHSDPAFRRFLLAIRLTGCRPGEVRGLIWEWVNLDTALWILPQHKSISQQRHPQPRIIPLPDAIVRMCRWLARAPHQPRDHVFLNLHSRPYSKDCLVRKMSRIRKRADIAAKAGEQIVLYSHRHTFGTELCGRITDIELAELMGHTDIRTTRLYTHLNPHRLHEIRRRAQAARSTRESA